MRSKLSLLTPGSSPSCQQRIWSLLTHGSQKQVSLCHTQVRFLRPGSLCQFWACYLAEACSPSASLGIIRIQNRVPGLTDAGVHQSCVPWGLSTWSLRQSTRTLQLFSSWRSIPESCSPLMSWVPCWPGCPLALQRKGQAGSGQSPLPPPPSGN
jgi:hypothetical protein